MEAWTPKPGDRVRLALSPECPYVWCKSNQAYNGQPGKVLICGQVLEGYTGNDGHNYMVSRGVLPGGGEDIIGWFAANELDPVEGTDEVTPANS